MKLCCERCSGAALWTFSLGSAPRLRFAGGFTPLDLDGDGNGVEPISPAMRTMLLDQMEGQSLL